MAKWWLPPTCCPIAAGLVPCHAVVMVMLLCQSMGVIMHGLPLSACIVLGMAATIAIVVTVIVLANGGILSALPAKQMHLVEDSVGVLAGRRSS